MEERLNLDLLNLCHGDCRNILPQIPDDSVDLIFTSPPYAEQRKRDYLSVKPDDYVCWFSEIAYQIKRILTPTGSFLLNLASHCEGGERHLYPFETVLALRNVIGLKYIDQYAWYKSASAGICGPRLRASYEPIYHFAKNVPFMNLESVQIRSKGTFAKQRGWAGLSVTGNNGGFHDITEQSSGFTNPDGVLYFPTSLLIKDGKYKHSAKFPMELAHFFVKGFCPPDGTVCDPFCGSGMTLLASLIENKKCIGIEVEQKYYDLTLKRLTEFCRPEIKKIRYRDYDIFAKSP